MGLAEIMISLVTLNAMSQAYTRAWGFYDLRGMYKQGKFQHMKNCKC